MSYFRFYSGEDQPTTEVMMMLYTIYILIYDIYIEKRYMSTGTFKCLNASNAF